jgi:hypothetical protein
MTDTNSESGAQNNKRPRPSFLEPRHVEFIHWGQLDKDIESRLARLKKYKTQLEARGLERANAFELAATDLFVEKAQIHLTLRARIYVLAGTALAIVCMGVIASIICAALVPHLKEYADSWRMVVLFALRSAGIAGFGGAAVYFAASLSRACFHEATTLYNRRHALRFGRMFVYLKYGEDKVERAKLISLLEKNSSSTPEASQQLPATTQGAGSPLTPIATEPSHLSSPPRHDNLLVSYLLRDISAEELEKAFGWNLETYTGFRDMKPEQMSANIYNRAMDVMGKLVESLAKAKTSKAES